MPSYERAGVVLRAKGTYRQNQNAAQNPGNRDKSTTREEHDKPGLLGRPQVGGPQHGNRNGQKVDIGEDVEDDGDKDVDPGYSRLTVV